MHSSSWARPTLTEFRKNIIANATAKIRLMHPSSRRLKQNSDRDSKHFQNLSIPNQPHEQPRQGAIKTGSQRHRRSLVSFGAAPPAMDRVLPAEILDLQQDGLAERRQRQPALFESLVSATQVARLDHEWPLREPR